MHATYHAMKTIPISSEIINSNKLTPMGLGVLVFLMSQDEKSATMQAIQDRFQYSDWAGLAFSCELLQKFGFIHISDVDEQAETNQQIYRHCVCTVILTQEEAPPEQAPQKKLLLKLTEDNKRDIWHVFLHWCQVMGKDKRKSPCDKKRTQAIHNALKLFSVEDCKLAIDGCAKTPHNMGIRPDGSPGGIVYNGVELIFRTADNIERFIETARSPLVQPTQKGTSSNDRAEQAANFYSALFDRTPVSKPHTCIEITPESD